MRLRFITLLLLCTPAAYAASPEECLNMARNYLAAVTKNQSDTQIVYAREKFMSHCKTGNPFNQELTQLIIEDKAMKAIHVRQNPDRKSASSTLI
ncbi:MAG: hypothetical protein RQ982_06690 [Gammaproteobacteria bacterium]|nr:hypothetical protein [Gammaproteobacteria bacterium]